MKKTLLTLTIAAGSVFAADAPRTFTGVITDTMCAKDHSHMGVTPDAKCVRECVRMDKRYKYALYDGKNVYVLSDQQTPEKYAAQKVKVKGTLFTKTNIIKVDSIEPAK
jgi:MinD-like ATPase involved in chromosome partitioning or flagellar assembly